MKLFEKTLSEQPIFKGRIIRVHVDEVELENGSTSKREVVEHPGGVCAAVLTEKNELLFVRQFRYPYQKVLLELPAGKLEPGEDPLEAMKREQREETGTRSDQYHFLGNIYPTPGYCGEIIRLWACRACGQRGSLSLDEDEFIEVQPIPIEQAVEMVMANEIPDAKTQIGVLKTARLLQEGKL